jgi:hypothetical protein
MLLSERTKKYVEALAREGDKFDFDGWLRRVREEEARAKPSLPTVRVGERLAVAGDNVPQAPHCGVRTGMPVHAGRTVTVTRRAHRAKSELGGQSRLRLCLRKVRAAWDDFQRRRARDAVYRYLEAVFNLVQRYSDRSRRRKLVRGAFKFARLPRVSDADPFAAVIRCTSDVTVDRRAISKWARALRYAAVAKPAGDSLTSFMKGRGGINACANCYTADADPAHRD